MEETIVESVSLADYERAEAELRASEGRISFYVHAAVYVLVTTMLVVLNLVYAREFLWFFIPLVGWGIGLTMHYLFAVRFVGRETADWQARVEHRAVQMQRQRVSAT